MGKDYVGLLDDILENLLLNLNKYLYLCRICKLIT